MRKSLALFVLLVLVNAMVDTGCATILRRNTQAIPVTSSPTGASVALNGVARGTTPLELELTRKKKDQVIRIESPGYNPVEIRLKRTLSGLPVVGNLVIAGLAGLLIGGASYLLPNVSESESYWVWALTGAAFAGLGIFTDTSGGSGYDLTPAELIVTLKKADGPPRVDTILIDAADFSNIKWIRVHRD